MTRPGARGRSRRSGRGLSLVEMCLALAVLGMVAASIATAFIAASDTVEKGRERIELIQAGRAAMNRMLAELRTATAIEERADSALTIYCEGATSNGAFARRVKYWVDGGALWREVEGETAQTLAEHVTGFTTGGLTLWSKLNAAADVLAPQVGPAGGFFGSPYWCPVYFADGYYGYAGSYNRIWFPAAGVLNPARGTIEFWLRPEFSAVWRGQTRDKYLIEAVGGAEIVLFFDHSARELKCRVKGKEVKWEPTWSVGQRVHIAIVWDCTGQTIEGGRTVALYIDGELAEKGSQTGKWTAASFGTAFSFGDYQLYEAEAAIENLRVYDYCKTGFQDRYLQQAPGLLRVRLDMADEETGETVSIEGGVPVL